jgi:hypothetical protein
MEENNEDDYYNGGIDHITGYDLANYLRLWLQDKGYKELSVCEVILLDANFAHLRQFIGLANVFWSHIQLEGFFGQFTTLNGEDEAMHTTLSMMNTADKKDTSKILPPEASRFIWLDYVCLRQCQNDFDVYSILALIKDIGTMVAAVDMKFSYTKRCFCVLEFYAAVSEGCRFMCVQTMTAKKSTLQALLAPERPTEGFASKYWVGPIRSAEATARRQKDKDLIMGFIRLLSGGFQKFDHVVSQAILDSCSEE